MERINIFIEIQSKDEGLVSEIMEAPKKMDVKADLPGNAVIMNVSRTKLFHPIRDHRNSPPLGG
jgi:hypothetical protein